MSPKIVDKEQKAEEIARAALKVFIRKGYHRTTMAEIAEEAGMGKGTLYEYFKNKESLFRFIFDRFFEDFYRGLLSVLEGLSHSEEKLLAILDFSADHFDRWNDVCKIWLDFYSEMHWNDEEGGLEIQRVYEMMRALLSSVIQEGQEAGIFRDDLSPREVASILVSVFDGLIMQYIFDPDCFSMKALEDTAKAILLRGLIKS